MRNQLKSHTYRKSIAQLEVGSSITQLYLGLKKNPIEIPEDLFIIDQMDSDQNFEYSQIGDYSRVNLALTNYQRLDPTLNQADKQTISVFFLDFIQNWPENKQDYTSKKNVITEIIMDRLHITFPGIKEYVKSVELGTPKTMKKYTRNPEGAIYGFSQGISQSGIHRLHSRLPNKKLTLVGAWTRPGGGYQGAVMSGVMEADKINRWINR